MHVACMTHMHLTTSYSQASDHFPLPNQAPSHFARGYDVCTYVGTSMRAPHRPGDQDVCQRSTSILADILGLNAALANLGLCQSSVGLGRHAIPPAAKLHRNQGGSR